MFKSNSCYHVFISKKHKILDLKKQTTISLFWNGFNKIGYQIIALLVGIVTARLLTPTDFGYIAALAVFTMLSNILVESGFTAALVRRKNNTQADYSTAFYFNVALSLIFYIALFISAPTIADYFNMPPLTKLARILFLAIIINSLFIIPNIILTRALRFKEIAIAELTGMIISSIITVTMAITGFGYWAIAAQQISQLVVKVGIIWNLSKWRPTFDFRFGLLKEVFSFSILLIISSLISSVTRYIYNFFIGPRYSADDLGYYGQAFKFHQIPYTVISSTITGVSYPVLSSLNNEKERQMLYIQKIMRITAFITFPVMIGLYCIAPNFISVILTDKWMPMLPYFKILIITGIAMPFISLNLNIFNVIGRPRLYFLLECLRNGLIIALLFVLNSTIETMLYGYLIATYTSLIISSYLLKKLINYSIIEQIFHILPSLILAIIMGVTISTIETKLAMGNALQLFLQLSIGALTYIALAWGCHLQIMTDILEMAKRRFTA